MLAILVHFRSTDMDILPNVNDLVKGLFYTTQCAVTQLHGHFRQRCNLQERLYLIQWLAMGRVSNPQAIIVESTIFGYVSRIIDVTVVESIIGIVPISIRNFSIINNYRPKRSLLTFCRIQSRGSEFAE